ncbi:MAG: glycosyltransferase [Chitinispirillaceae bacterium]|nr:glycosyltransferase [Chitinispirillaceae bacterium]
MRTDARFDTGAMRLFFVNKFGIQSASPMASVSIFATYSLASLGIPTTLIIEGDSGLDPKTVLQERFGFSMLPHYTVRICSRYVFKIRMTTLFYLRACLYILRSRKRGERSVVVTRNTTFLPYLVFLRLLGCLVFFETHAYHGSRTLPGLPAPPRPRWFTMTSHYYCIERVCMNQCHGCICITYPQHELYAGDFLVAPSTVLPLGAPAIRISGSSLSGPARRHLVYIGRRAPSIEDALVFEALARCRHLGITFAWLGLRPDDMSKLGAMADQYHVADRVDLKEWMPHTQMADYLVANAGAGLAAYRRNFMTAALVSPTKVFDYFAAGVPVVAARLETLSVFVREGREGVLYEPGSVDSLAGALSRLFSDKRTYHVMRKQCVAAAGEYSWNNRARKMASFIDMHGRKR